MALSAGDKVGPYEIIALIGKGGMGEVYRAHDPRLGRDVAIKVSAAQFTERFDREARAIAALNHPNICTLYDVGPNYLVMEYVEGEAPKGPLPLDEALRLAEQIAEALAAAHEKGITHRDLKPANIKIRPDGTVKVLDFGLAKIREPEVRPVSENSPTLSMAATQAGMILGTAAYMAPEQARGKPADQRADIWAFAVVLYEMIAGKPLFQGEDVTEILAAVVKEQPDLSAAPSSVQGLLRLCLEKDPKKRLQAIGDRRLVDAMPAPSPARLGVVAWAAAGAFAVAAAALAFIHFRETPPVAEVMRFQVPPPGKSDFSSSSMVVSPDGRRIAFTAPGPSGSPQLWVRSLDALDARPLAGTENPATPQFWSPDSGFIGFATQNRLKKVNVSGGPPQTLCDLPSAWRGGAWSPTGVIIFGTAGHGLMRVAEAGGAASALTNLDTPRGDPAHVLPMFLPDGRHFLYYLASGGESAGVYLGSLDAKPDQQNAKRLLASDSGPAFADGHLLFAREGSLMAQPFDAAKLVLSGDAVPIAEGLPRQVPPPFSASRTGVLAYRAGGGAGGNRQLTWFDRGGKSQGTTGDSGDYNSVSLSPDGTRVAVSRVDGGNTDIWLHEFVRGTSSRFTFDPAQDLWAVWSPDGSRIIFSSQRGGTYDLYQKASNNAGNEEPVLKSSEPKYAQDWSPDGHFLLYSVAGGGLDLWVLPLEGDRKPQPYLKTEFNESQARFSPDGRFVAYTSDASGKSEIYVQPFPAPAGGKWMVSKGGGVEPRWRRDGKELYYISADSKLMAVDVTTNPTFKAGVPKALFQAPIYGGGGTNNVTRYDASADGKKFLINSERSEGGAEVTPITVILNWAALLKK